MHQVALAVMLRAASPLGAPPGAGPSLTPWLVFLALGAVCSAGIYAGVILLVIREVRARLAARARRDGR
jgi:hypothetical protein